MLKHLRFACLLIPALASAHMDTLPALHAWSQRCHQAHPAYPTACTAYLAHTPKTQAQATRFLKQYWRPTTVSTSLLTGYYTPLYTASYLPSNTHDAPLYLPPSTSSQPCSRQQINHHQCKQLGPILAWVNRIDRFFLQIQGSGLLQFPHGEIRQVAYAGRNGYPYVPIGQWLLKTHRLSQPISMQSIRHYLTQHPKEVDAILNKDPAFIYLRWQIPIRITGASGYRLTPWHSVAVDPAHIPYGQFIELNHVPGPHSHLLTVADDTGSAIGPHHVDLYLGQGKAAETLAGQLNQRVSAVVWLPKANQ